MVADSITDSELFHGTPISRDFAKKRKANWFWKLKQWKIDARRRQWIYQWKRANVGEEDNGSRLKSLLTDRKTASDRFSYLHDWKIDREEGRYEFTKCDDDDHDETDLGITSSASSPTSVLKNKDSGSNKSLEDCFCCSKQVTEEEEEDFDDAFDNFDGFRDALNFFEKEEDPNPTTSQRNKSSPENLFHKDKSKQESSSQKPINNNRRNRKKSDQKKECDDEISECPICSEMMDATDLSFLPCPCGFRLCLFCHNKINENDGRCPSCRNKYDQTSNISGEASSQQRGRGALRLSRSFKGLDRA